MQKMCAFCGKPFEAKRAAAVFCGATCRQRRQRAGAPIVPLEVVGGERHPANLADAIAMAAMDTRNALADSPLVVTTRATLEVAGVLGTVSGQAALILAAQVAAGRDTLAGLSSGVKQLEASVAAALASVTRADQMDEVTRRRDEKLRAAGRA